MQRFLLIPFVLIVSLAYGFGLFEPSIECTVIKVHSTAKALGQTKFPKLYQSIYNDPMTSTLIIAGKKLLGVKPETLLKTDNFEKISIIVEAKTLELELKGKPISRNGILKFEGKLLAEVTCH